MWLMTRRCCPTSSPHWCGRGYGNGSSFTNGSCWRYAIDHGESVGLSATTNGGPYQKVNEKCEVHSNFAVRAQVLLGCFGSTQSTTVPTTPRAEEGSDDYDGCDSGTARRWTPHRPAEQRNFDDTDALLRQPHTGQEPSWIGPLKGKKAVPFTTAGLNPAGTVSTPAIVPRYGRTVSTLTSVVGSIQGRVKGPTLSPQGLRNAQAASTTSATKTRPRLAQPSARV